MLVLPAADGRSALEEGCAVGDLLGGKVEVVGAGFDGDGQAFGAGGLQLVERERCGEVDDVQAEAVLTAEADHQADGFEFGLVGAGGEVGGVLAPVGGLEAFGGAVDGAGELGVDEQREAGLGDVGKRGFELLLVDHGEAVAAGVDEEALVAEDAGAREREEVLLVVGDGSAPGRPVDEALAAGGFALGFECGDGGGLGQAVQRHVDEGGEASGGGGAGGGAEAFPLGASGLVDVDVRVDEAGKDGVVAAVVEDGVGGKLGGAADGADAALFDEERCRLRASRGDDAI